MSMYEHPYFVRPAGRLLAAAGLASFLACSQQPPAASPSTAAPAANREVQAAQASAAPAPEVPQIVLEPPDGKWLVDGQGREHFLLELPKVEGWYHWLDEEKTRVRLWYGMTYDVAEEGEDHFKVKVYKVEQQVEVSKRQREEPTAEQREAVAASYRNTTGTVDRLVFAPFGRGLPTQGQWRNGFKIADMNGDGNPDIVHGPARKGNGLPNIFLGDGKGSWRQWEVRFPRLPYDYGDVAVADFNGDGRLDIALAMHLRGLTVLVADGAAGFKEWGRGLDFQVAGRGDGDSGFSSRTLEVADMNGDGRPDLITLGEGPRMAVSTTPGQGSSRGVSAGAYGARVYLNQGDGTWIARTEPEAGVRLFGDDLAVADFTNDRRLDMILGSSVLGEKDILRIGGDGGGWTSASLADLRPVSHVGAVDVADFNGDGRLDLAVGYLANELGVWRTGIDVFLGRHDSGGGWERQGVAVVESREWLTALDSGDLDGDGRLDLAAATGKGEIWLFLGRGDGTFLREESPEIPAVEGGCRGYDIRIVDLDGDAEGELVAEFAGEPSALFAPEQCLQEGLIGAWDPRRK